MAGEWLESPGARPTGEPPALDTGVAHVARVYDYWLGGTANYAADREAAEQAMAAYPDLALSVRANRAFLARTVRWLARDVGIRQFLDIGTGIPAADNTHEVAQSAAPESRVVYADHDPIVLAHARSLLSSTPGGATDYLDADLREPGPLVGAAARTLDFRQPVAIILMAVLQLYAELQAGAPDRFVAGLGGPQQPRPLGPLNDYLDQLDHGDPPVPAGRRILAALGPRKLELARDRAAGAVPLLVTPAYTRQARRILGAGSTLIISQMLVLDTDAARAREAARMPLSFLSGIRGYRANFARMGFADSDIAGLSDRLVDDLVIWGSADTVTARVREHLDAGADQVALTVRNLDGQPRAIEAARELAGRFPR